MDMNASPSLNIIAKLYTAPGGWGLPTICPDALSAHALLRFAGIHYAASPSLPPADPPITLFERPLSDGILETQSEAAVCGFAGLVGRLAADSGLPDPNQNLTPVMIAESTAFATLLIARFAPAQLYEFYVKQSNYDDLFHQVLVHSGPFPVNRIISFLARRNVMNTLRATGKSAPEAYFHASIAIAALSTRLGDRNKYFYGDRPAVLDAIVFGQLAVVLSAPLPDSEIRSMVAGHANLINFVRRIKGEYFPEDPRAGGWGGDLDPEELSQLRKANADRRAAKLRREHEAAEAAARDAAKESGTAEMDEDEEDVRRRHNAYFIYAGVFIFAAHLLFSSDIEFEVGS